MVVAELPACINYLTRSYFVCLLSSSALRQDFYPALQLSPFACQDAAAKTKHILINKQVLAGLVPLEQSDVRCLGFAQQPESMMHQLGLIKPSSLTIANDCSEHASTYLA